jgi:aspartyl-tRNA(Asn)/glutamyl-tRNA(Gln) amidotransferase subunit A
MISPLEQTIASAAAAFAEGRLTSEALTQAYLTQIQGMNGALNAYLTVTNQEALEAAKAADARRAQGASLGVLDGIPLAIKDNILIKGGRTTAASTILTSYVAPYDATVIEKLKAQGVVFLGKTNLDEFAMGGSTEHSAFGPSKHPRDLERVPGGSSGGSAVAVAADLCVAALGSDTGGSIRQPASFCGIVGFKPSYGRVSRYGLMAMASSLDQIGPMTKTVEDAATLFHAIQGIDQHDQTTHAFALPAKHPSVKGLKVGLPRQAWGDGIQEDVRTSLNEAMDKLRAAGAELIEVDLPYSDEALAVYYILMPCEVSANMSRYDGIRYGHRAAADTLLDTYQHSRHEGIGSEVRRRILLGTFALSKGYVDAYYRQARKVQVLIRNAYEHAFAGVDVLLTPTAPSTAFRIGENTTNPLSMYLQDVFTVGANVAGIPAISLPAADRNGLPVGLQLMGAYGTDESLLSVAAEVEALLAS